MEKKETLRWQNHQGEHYAKRAEFDVILCDTCGFKHTVPLPSESDLEKFYGHHFYTEAKPAYFSHYEEDLEWWNLTYQERYDLFDRFLSDRSSRRILDIGSGPGYFLLRGKENGWETVGIEPSEAAADYSRQLGLNIIQSVFSEAVAKSIGQFDVVNLSEVLEHIPNPEQILKRIHSVVNEDGLLCIVVPNDCNPFQLATTQLKICEPWWISPPQHLNYFTFDTLAQLFDRCGFEVISKRSTFPIDMFLLMGDVYIGNDALGRACHAKRKTFEKNLSRAGISHIKQEMYEKFAQMGIGREIQMIARKKSR